jgi:putative membrane protein
MTAKAGATIRSHLVVPMPAPNQRPRRPGGPQLAVRRMITREVGLRLLVTWAGNCLGLLLASALISSVSYGHDAGRLLLAALILALVNFALRPLALVMALPAVVLTLGAAVLLVNALMLWLTSVIVPGLLIGGFFSTLGAAVLISLVNLVVRHWTGTSAGARRRRAWAAWRRAQ